MLADFARLVPDNSSKTALDAVYTLKTGREPGQDMHFELWRDGARLEGNFDPGRVVDHLVRDVSREALSRPQSDYLLVHAGVAATPAGGAVLLTGESGSAKTTIVAALVR